MLFVYGTLQDPDVLGAVLGRQVDVTRLKRALAPGYRAVAYPGRVYPALVPCAGTAATGLLVEGLTPLDMAVLDAFEGDEYRRETMRVEAGGAMFTAQAFLPVVAVDADAPAWSLADWMARHKPAVLGQETGTARALRERLSARLPA